MLNKISNINSGLDLNRSVKYKKYKKNGSGSFHEHYDINDSINISPALAFFEDSNWKLRNLNKSSDNKIHLEFAIKEFDFRLVVDTSSLSSLSYLKYSVHKLNEMSLNKSTITTDIVVELKQRLNINFYDNLNMLDVLFSRISRLNIHDELTRKDTSYLNQLYDGIQHGLYKEFEAISSVVLNFIEKYNGLNIELKKQSENLIENNIAIDRIKIINV
jgi:hypothetical protein